MKAEWTGTVQNDVNVSWSIRETKIKLKYKVYFIEIPYKNYWRQVNSTEILQVTHIKVSGLHSNKKYRFTVICLREYGEHHKDLIIDGKPSSVYLVPKERLPLQYQQIIAAPVNLRCVTVGKNEVNLSWDGLHSSNEIWGYKVSVLNELDNVVDIYETRKPHLNLTRLYKGTWYGARVEAYGLSNRYYSKTDYTICRTKTNGKLNPH